ncbi:hypothetical protein [Streptomyces shaanxiensis]|uniref:PH domain-containing protein n=1 Tax=Streptomyces shaanxiensis TaxID=653357 RepID=A0ABP7VWG4_9ACTN
MTDQLPIGEKDLTGVAGVAWDDAATRRAWWRQTGRSLLLVGVCAAWWTWYSGTSVAVRERVVWLTVAFFLASLIGLPLHVLAELPNAWRVRRLLRAHPWHTVDKPRHGLSGHARARNVSDAWFEVPDPDAPGRRLPLIMKVPLWWSRRMERSAPAERRAQIARLWYCGLLDDQVVIAASRTTQQAPRRLRHRYLRHGLLPDSPERTDVPLPDPAGSALSHPATAHVMRRRLFNRVAALLLVWPAVLAVQIAEIVADEGHDLIGLVVLGALFEVTLLPVHVFVIVATRRMARRLAEHPWRCVDCEIRSRGNQQLIKVDGRTLTPSPFRAYVDQRASRLWIAGPAQGPCVVSVPGGAEPIGVAMSTTDNRSR